MLPHVRNTIAWLFGFDRKDESEWHEISPCYRVSRRCVRDGRVRLLEEGLCEEKARRQSSCEEVLRWLNMGEGEGQDRRS